MTCRHSMQDAYYDANGNFGCSECDAAKAKADGAVRELRDEMTNFERLVATHYRGRIVRVHIEPERGFVARLKLAGRRARSIAFSVAFMSAWYAAGHFVGGWPWSDVALLVLGLLGVTLSWVLLPLASGRP